MTKNWTESTPSEPPAAVCSSSGRGFAPPSRRTNRPHKDRHLSKLLQLAIAIRQNYIDRVYGYAVKNTYSREEADELSQEILLTVMRSMPNLKDNNKFEP